MWHGFGQTSTSIVILAHAGKDPRAQVGASVVWKRCVYELRGLAGRWIQPLRGVGVQVARRTRRARRLAVGTAIKGSVKFDRICATGGRSGSRHDMRSEAGTKPGPGCGS